MAEELDDCEYWLPPQFLTEDDLLMDFKKGVSKDNGSNKGMGLGRDFGAPQELGYGGFGAGPFLSSAMADLSSPVESLTETESDEDDYITGLTRKMAQSTLHDSVYDHENTKAWRLSGSPQSTLCGVLGGGCGCNQSSSRGSPNYPSRVSSPPTPEMARNADDGAWDLLYAAAGEVARMKMMEEAAAALYQTKNGVWAPPRRPSPVTVPSQNPHLSTYQQLQLAQFQRLKQLQTVKNQQGGPYQSRIAKNGGGGVGFRPSAWPTLQQAQQQLPGSGMRAVFLGNPAGGAKRECSGTGVFIPRRTGAPAESRKKPVCSTVLLPDRVVQALNLNVADSHSHSHSHSHQLPQGLHPRFNANAAAFTHDYDGAGAGAGLRNHRSIAPVLAQPKKHNPQAMANHHHHHELRLPQEWTY